MGIMIMILGLMLSDRTSPGLGDDQHAASYAAVFVQQGKKARPTPKKSKSPVEAPQPKTDETRKTQGNQTESDPTKKESSGSEDVKRLAEVLKFIVGVLGVVVGLITAGVTAVGIYLTHVTNRRNSDLKELEIKRQQIDTFVESAKLLSTEGGGEVSQTQRAAVLFSLAKLDQLDFSLTLLGSFWLAGKVDTESAVYLVDEALKTDSVSTQDRAALILLDNSSKLTQPTNGGYTWPPCVEWTWKPQIGVDAREYLVRALVNLVPTLTKSQWDLDSLTGVFINLYCAQISDPEPGIKWGAAKAALEILRELDHHFEEIPLPDKRKTVASLLTEIESSITNADASELSQISASLEEGIIRIKNQWT